MDKENVIFVGDNILDALIRRDGRRLVGGVKLCLKVNKVYDGNQNNTPHVYLVGVYELLVLTIGVVVPFIVGDVNVFSFEEKL